MHDTTAVLGIMLEMIFEGHEDRGYVQDPAGFLLKKINAKLTVFEDIRHSFKTFAWRREGCWVT